MPKKTKLNLNDLSVKSFKTSKPNEIRGGESEISACLCSFFSCNVGCVCTVGGSPCGEKPK